jgi:hypothetical protein
MVSTGLPSTAADCRIAGISSICHSMLGFPRVETDGVRLSRDGDRQNTVVNVDIQYIDLQMMTAPPCDVLFRTRFFK